jgi:small subunit ribosomal protein S17e
MMGRIRTSLIKKMAKELLEKYEERFSDDFEQNKKVLEEIAEIPSKNIRNRIAGYITSLKRSKAG